MTCEICYATVDDEYIEDHLLWHKEPKRGGQGRRPVGKP